MLQLKSADSQAIRLANLNQPKSFWRRQAFDEAFDARKDIFHHELDALAIWMQVIGQLKFGDVHDAFKKEGVER